jgi:phage portal protein BeeE
MVPAEECVHWVPTGLEDPLADFRGRSPLTPVYRDVAGDDGMSRFKIRYLQNDATPNMIIKYPQKLQSGTVDAIRERMQGRYGGPDNAGKTLVLDQGADLTLVGNSLSQMDFGNVLAAGSERILAACSVPGVLVGLEPLRGAGRGYQESMQKFAGWARSEWRSVCGTLERLLDVPAGNRLWFDESDIAALQDGLMERGQAALVRMQALLAAVQAGFTHESAIAAVDSMDLSQLKAGGVGTPGSSQPVQHMLGQPGQPGATASPLPATLGRLPVGSTSPGDGGNGSRPLPRPASVRR